MKRETPLPKQPSQLTVSHGLYLNLKKYKIHGKSALGHALRKSREALAAMFPNGPDAAASVLITQIIYKAMRLESFIAWDYQTGEASPKALNDYVAMSNSLRNDLTILVNLAQREAPAPQVPDLKDYLAGLQKVNRGG